MRQRLTHRRARAALRPGEAGVTLVDTMIGLGIGVLVALTFGTLTVRFVQVDRQLAMRTDLAALREQIAAQLDCEKTFAAAGIDPQAPGGSCKSSSAALGQTAPFLRLIARGATGDIGLYDAATNTARVGAWTVRASCSAADGTLVVRAARPDGKGGFFADPLTHAVQSWDGPRSALLFGNDPAAGPLCAGAFKHTSPAHKSCPPGQYVQTIDATGGTIACIAPVGGGPTKDLDCPAGKHLRHVDGGGGAATCIDDRNARELCLSVQGAWNGAKCVVNMRNTYGGVFERGESPKIKPDCELDNPFTHNCSCPVGYAVLSLDQTVETDVGGSPKHWHDQDNICIRL
jgi:hypothetical protein